jgi:anti-anti-sigma factor
MSEDNRLDVRIAAEAGASIVHLTGEIDMTNSPMLRDQLQAMIDRDPQRVIFEMSGVHYVDSSGIGTLVELKRKFRRGRGPVVLVGVQPRVRSLLEITRLDKFFTLASTLDEGRRL